MTYYVSLKGPLKSYRLNSGSHQFTPANEIWSDVWLHILFIEMDLFYSSQVKTCVTMENYSFV